MKSLAPLFMLLLLGSAIAALPTGRQSLVNGPRLEGEAVTCDYPTTEHMWNIGGRDGAGMCVMSSIEMSAIYQGLEQMRGLRDWCAREDGGAYPSKVDDQLQRFCKAKRIEVPPYLQYEGPDPGPIMDLADRTGRLICCTYGYSPRYVSARNPAGVIYHMVCAPRCRDRLGVVMDNNAVGGVNKQNLSEWMTRDELIRRVRFHRNSGWVFVWLAPPPPPPSS